MVWWWFGGGGGGDGSGGGGDDDHDDDNDDADDSGADDDYDDHDYDDDASPWLKTSTWWKAGTKRQLLKSYYEALSKSSYDFRRSQCSVPLV